MGFRFRKTIRLLPGVRLNLSKRGGSISLGGNGATVNFGPQGERTTYRLPGTGVSHQSYTPYGKRSGIKAWLLVGLMAAAKTFGDKVPFLSQFHF